MLDMFKNGIYCNQYSFHMDWDRKTINIYCSIWFDLLILSLFKITWSLLWKQKLIARLLLLVYMLYPSCSACGSHWYVTRVMTFLLCANISSYRDTIKWIGVDGDIKAHGENFLGMNYCTRKNVITNIPFEWFGRVYSSKKYRYF